MFKKIISRLLMSSLLLMAMACSKEKVIFEKDYPLQNARWLYRDTLDFNFDITDTLKLYDIALSLTHQSDYPMQNLYTNIYTAFPSGERLKQQLSLELADNTGKWEGKCSGNTCRFDIKLQENAFFNKPGKYVITLEQFTRTDSLPAIKSIGLKVIDKAMQRNVEVVKK